MRLGTPGPQFHHYFGDPFVKLGTPLKRVRARSAQLFNCLQTTQLLSKGSSGHSENENIKRMACTSPLIHQSVSDGSQTGSTADVGACSDNDIADVENQKNEARFSFSQIHQYLQYGSYPSDFHKSDKLALRKRSKFFKSADGSLHYVGGGKQGIALCLLPHYLSSVLSYFILQ